ncbi:hypothetical protein AB9E14_28055 [Rhizobium leguminosarum]|uniref:hypothetical protein n=1 Tax=Rhizobium leguminosarum TaxID=384 RepID=UPI001030062C|nr:hypothetical protein [Rhizobium leguminosarum]QIO76253.1 hypothetical protein HA459_30145 [Rhizobium leguminosarum bv. trifolii]QIO83272.1 hypothetical protein HA460_30180 [Rhizobium leguminosarum bv. trifolii]TAU16472.1 hypothetical protein ELI50_27080 [Rhizobium leguminosarum]TAU34833.1 hypothetical protein ELI51_33105 [Rhizobium leguminosarum]TAX43987.1 hypothetical protein ELH99_31470 [Rhizobium leguminosarum]
MTQFFETTQGIMAMGALIAAGGLTAGACIPAVIQLARKQINRRPRSEARNLAMMTVLALDNFVGASYAAVRDIPEFNPMDEGEFTFHVPDPVLSLPKDADWKLFTTELSDEILWLSNRVKNLNYALDSLDLSRPGFDGFFEKRQEGYAGLAAEAMDLIERMLEKFGLTLPTKPDYYRQREGLASAILSVGERSSGRRTTATVTQSNGSNVLQLFPKTGDEAD